MPLCSLRRDRGHLLKPSDVLIVGAGPAGLTAAIYLARFRLTVRVTDASASRAALIPRTYNHAGYPGGISGKELLSRMKQQAGEFGVKVQTLRVDSLERDGELFCAYGETDAIEARAVLLATGVINRRPRIDESLHAVALERGLIRYCPICDGYEVTDRKIAVLGTATHGRDEAVFLRMYTREVTLIAPDAEHSLSQEERRDLDELGVSVIDGPCGLLSVDQDRIIVPTPGRALGFDSLYPALGSTICSELAVGLGARTTDEGCLIVDEHQRTTVSGLYAAGDVVKGLDQISHAMGGAGVAATAIRNDLAAKRTLAR